MNSSLPTAAAQTGHGQAIGGLPPSPTLDLQLKQPQDPDCDNLLEVAQLDQQYQRSAQRALEVLADPVASIPYPDLRSVRVDACGPSESEEVTGIVRRLLSVRRLFDERGTVVLVRAEPPADSAAEPPTTRAAIYFNSANPSQRRALLFCFISRQWRVQHPSVYLLRRLRQHFRDGLIVETPLLSYALRPTAGQLPDDLIDKITHKWRSTNTGDRFVAVQKLGGLMSDLNYHVVDQYLRGDAYGAIDELGQFTIQIPAIRLPPDTFVKLPPSPDRRPGSISKRR